MNYLLLLLFPIVGGLAWRIRGQSEIWGDTVSRYCIWGVPVGGLVLLQTHNIMYAIVSVALAGIGATLGYWGQFDFSVPGNWNVKNYLMLTATAMSRFLPLFIASCLTSLQWNILPAVLAGISFVPIYMFCFTYLKSWNWNSYFNQPSCCAEFLFGAVIYTSLGIFLQT